MTAQLYCATSWKQRKVTRGYGTSKGADGVVVWQDPLKEFVMIIEPSHLEVTTFRHGLDKVLVRIVHLPSGLSVKGEGKSESRLRDSLLKELESKLENTEFDKL